jgi:hypothetical protein
MVTGWYPFIGSTQPLHVFSGLAVGGPADGSGGAGASWDATGSARKADTTNNRSAVAVVLAIDDDDDLVSILTRLKGCELVFDSRL